MMYAAATTTGIIFTLSPCEIMPQGIRCQD